MNGSLASTIEAMARQDGIQKYVRWLEPRRRALSGPVSGLIAAKDQHVHDQHKGCVLPDRMGPPEGPWDDEDHGDHGHREQAHESTRPANQHAHKMRHRIVGCLLTVKVHGALAAREHCNTGEPGLAWEPYKPRATGPETLELKSKGQWTARLGKMALQDWEKDETGISRFPWFAVRMGSGHGTNAGEKGALRPAPRMNNMNAASLTT